MTSRQLDEERIFHVARTMEDSEIRREYLDQICAGDQALRERVEALLEVHEQEQDFLKSSPDPAPTVDQPPLSERPGISIGRYKLMEQIGEGGMGIVFVAEQERPIRRKVALKVIKPGMDSKAVVARFEAERQALAMMDHPNIARVLDAGTTESGRPYFAMELVKGIPITEYCDQNKLTIRERLDLFVQACQAIQHAHQKGIIHRDIKPSNVLVTLHDGKPIPKVIDFGVAKALNARLTDKTIYTEHLQIVGTLLYMSPEQAELSGLDVDTRSDVYSLGVLLYELLTGTTPFQKVELDQAGFDEQRRIIRETDPPRASQRISSLGETATSIAEHRKTDPRKLRQSVRGDLDWIVLKALEKDRTRRFETALGLAKDIQKFLNCEPIEARPPSGFYRLHRFLRRNRTPAVAAAAFSLALLIGFAATAVALLQSSHNHRLAVERGTELESAYVKLREGFEVLQSQEEIQVRVKDWAALEAMSGDLERAEKAIELAEMAGAGSEWVHKLRGQVELFGGNTDNAIEHFERATAINKTSVATLGMLRRAYVWAGHIDDGRRVFKEMKRYEPKSAEDYLYLGLAMDELPHLDKSIAMRDSLLARTIRAEVLGRKALDSGDPRYVEQALTDITRAMTAADNPYINATSLSTYHVAMIIKGGDSIEELRQAADEAALRLEHSPNHRAGALVRARYFEWTGEDDKAETEWRRLIQHGRGLAMEAAAFFYERGDLASALSCVPGNQRSGRFLRACLLTEIEGRRNEALEIYDGLEKSFRSTLIPLLSGNREEARRLSQGLLENKAVRSPFENDILRFLSDDISPDDLVRSAGASPRNFCRAHHWIGVAFLADGETEEAKGHLQKCVDSGVSLDQSYRWAKAYLARRIDRQQ